MKKIITCFMLSLASCATTNASGLVTDGPTVAESTCDIADECCEIDGHRVCCFDDGKKIRCARDAQVPLGDVE